MNKIELFLLSVGLIVILLNKPIGRVFKWWQIDALRMPMKADVWDFGFEVIVFGGILIFLSVVLFLSGAS